jgi:hypothetical protein
MERAGPPALECVIRDRRTPRATPGVQHANVRTECPRRLLSFGLSMRAKKTTQQVYRFRDLD